MNSIPEHNDKRSETLKSLSLGPAPKNTEPRQRGLRSLFRPVGILVILISAVIGVLLLQPAGVRRAEIATLTNSVKPSKDSLATADKASLAQSGLSAVQASARDPAPATREITGSGYVVATRKTTIFSKYEGRVTGIAVELGDQVVARQALIKLDDANARFALERAQASLLKARQALSARTMDLSQALATLDRNERLAAHGAIARQALEEADLAAKLASNAVAQAEQDIVSAELALRTAEEQVAELTVRAPFSGTVTQLNAHVGDTVLARADSVHDNQSLLAITDMSSLVIDADVAEAQMSSLHPGQRGEAVLDGFPDQPFTIEVKRIAPIASAEKGTVTLRLSITHPPLGIRPNMAARVRITLIAPPSGDTSP